MPQHQFTAILIYAATQAEAKPIIEALELKEVSTSLDSALGAKVYQHKRNHITLTLVTSGQCKKHAIDRIGTNAASIITWEAIKEYKPDLIINAGTCGGFMEKTKIAEVFISKEYLVYHDRRLPDIKNLYAYGVGSFACYDFSEIAQRIGVKCVICSTGNSIIFSEEDFAMMKETRADIKEMEAAAVAEVAYIKNIPFTALKVVTDFIDHPSPTHEQFKNNFKIAMENLTNKLQAFLQQL